MASGAKKKTTMAKLNRERSLRERRFEKQAKKDAKVREREEVATRRKVEEDAPPPPASDSEAQPGS